MTVGRHILASVSKVNPREVWPVTLSWEIGFSSPAYGRRSVLAYASVTPSPRPPSTSITAPVVHSAQTR